jgi:hypothetical protein
MLDGIYSMLRKPANGPSACPRCWVARRRDGQYDAVPPTRQVP